MSISSPGLGSGIDVTSLVNSLVAAEAGPKTTRLDQREAGFQSEITALATLKGALSSFQTALSGLTDLTSFQQRTAATSNDAVFTVTADETAAVSSYGIEVVQLAEAHKLITQDGHFATSSDAVGGGTLRFTQGAASFSLTIDAGDTLENVRDAINQAEDNTGVSAAIINVDDGLGGTESKLVFTSTNTGLDNALTIEVDEDGNDVFNDAGDLDAVGLSRLINANLDELNAPLDGQIKVDAQLVSSSNNTFASVIDGVTITALSVGAGETLGVSLNTGAVKTQVTAFIESYNNLVQVFNELSFFDPATESAGALLGDATLRGVQNSLRQQISSQVSGLSTSFRTLAEIGVTTETDGQLTLDDETFDNALSNNFDDLGQLFASENGLANKLDSILEGYVGSSGIIDSKTSGLQSSIEDITDQRVALDRRLDALQSRLLSQFTALDTLVSSLTTTSNFLSTQLANLPGAFDPSSNS